MHRFRIAPFLMTLAGLASSAPALPQGTPETAAALVAVSVEVDGQKSALYPATDGSGRYYVEARKGCRYSVALANRTGERVGVVLAVDGLNAISGTRDEGRGRMYVLDPWQVTSVQGWRTSLQEVRQFTFVDERASYAARSEKANEKMGWIEVAAYRERRPFVRSQPMQEVPSSPAPFEPEKDEARPSASGANEAARDSAGAAASKRRGDAQARAYPGTGWGDRAHDPVVLVSFDPESEPAERVALRYEYRPALVALGVLPRRVPPRDRLWERDRAEPGFSQPPLW
jgi:hypothetical protein